MELIDMKSMSPATVSGTKGEHFKAWSKHVKAYTNAKLTGFRDALEAAEKCRERRSTSDHEQLELGSLPGGR